MVKMSQKLEYSVSPQKDRRWLCQVTILGAGRLMTRGPGPCYKTDPIIIIMELSQNFKCHTLAHCKPLN